MANSESERPSFIGPYRVVEVLGAGGMAVVYKVESSAGKSYALKIINMTSSLDADLAKRFRREVSLLCEIEHPNIMRVYDIGEWKNRPYYAMEYLQGKPLDEYLAAKGKLDEKEALQLVYAIAQALEAVHRLDILHRDIKPSNILLVKNKPYLMDFGIGCYYTGGSRLTRTGTIIGTPNYMPPEQAQGEWKKMGPWSDVYSLGTTLFHLLSGIPPFKGHSDIEVIINLTQKSLRPASRYNHTVRPETDMLLRKATRKDPADRYQSAGELAKEIRSLLYDRKPSDKAGKKRRPVQKKPNRFLVIGAVLFIVLICSLLIFPSNDKKHRKKNKLHTKTTSATNTPTAKITRPSVDISGEQKLHQIKPLVKQRQVSVKYKLTWPTDSQLGIDEMPELERKIRELREQMKNAGEKGEFPPEKIFELAKMYHTRADYHQAIATLQSIPAGQKSPDTYWKIFRIAVETEMFTHACYYAQYLQENFPTAPQGKKASLQLPKIQQKLSAIYAYPCVRRNACRLYSCLGFVRIASLEGQLGKRKRYLAQALKLSKNDYEFKPWIRCIGALDYISRKDFPSAQREISNAIRENEKIPAKKRYWKMGPELLFIQGVWHFHKKNYQQAKKSFSYLQAKFGAKVNNEILKQTRLYLKEIEYPSSNFELKRRLDHHIDTLLGILTTRTISCSMDWRKHKKTLQAFGLLSELRFLEGPWYHLVHHHLGTCLYETARKSRDIRQRLNNANGAIYHCTHARMMCRFSDPIFFLGNIAEMCKDRTRAEKYYRYCRKYPPGWVPGSKGYIERFFAGKK